MGGCSLTKLMTCPGFDFGNGHVMHTVSDTHRIHNSMRNGLDPGEVKLTKHRAGRLAKNLLEACHKHRELMWPKGRTSERFWWAVIGDTVWARGLTLDVVEEFALALAEGARCAMSRDQYARIKAAVEKDIPNAVAVDKDYPEVTMAAIRLMMDVMRFKRHLDNKGDESVSAYRGRLPCDSRYSTRTAWVRLVAPPPPCERTGCLGGKPRQ